MGGAYTPDDVVGPLALPSFTSATTPAQREAGWDAFITAYTPLLLRVARATAHDHDLAMDCYARTLEQLRDDKSSGRLSSYTPEAHCTFEAWLVVVTRRICLDHIRHKYGRARAHDASAEAARLERKRLVDLTPADVLAEVAATASDQSAALERGETLGALASVWANLTSRDQLLLRYRFDDGLSARQIAGLMGFRSQFHVYRRINLVLTSCRVALEEKGIRRACD